LESHGKTERALRACFLSLLSRRSSPHRHRQGCLFKGSQVSGCPVITELNSVQGQRYNRTSHAGGQPCLYALSMLEIEFYIYIRKEKERERKGRSDFLDGIIHVGPSCSPIDAVLIPCACRFFARVNSMREMVMVMVAGVCCTSSFFLTGAVVQNSIGRPTIFLRGVRPSHLSLIASVASRPKRLFVLCARRRALY
jgi:hypothetical protein